MNNNHYEKLIDLISDNDISSLQELLKAEPSLVEESDSNGVSPVFLAAARGHFELLRFLIEYSRTSLNIRDNNQKSLLHYAAESDNRELFAYVVQRAGFDLLDVDADCLTPLDMAVQKNSLSIIQYYQEHGGIGQKDLYRNPVLPGAYPDPSAIRVGEDYYMVTSSFIFFPAIPVLHSRDLVNWKTIGHAVANPDYLDMTELEDGRGFWAPDISFYEGKFYITATLRMNDTDDPVRRQMIVSSENAEGPYSRPVYIDEDGIDPSLFTDSDGKRYMLLNRGARLIPLDQKAEKAIGSAELLWYGAQKRAPEAPHLLQKDGYYYLFVSEGGTGRNHQISVARSRELKGPYQPCPYNPILTQRDPDHPIQRSGHGKLVSTPDGRWFILYLCSRMLQRSYSILGRETALDEVVWTKDGWPMINRNKGPSGAGIKPFPGNSPKKSGDRIEWFTGSELSLQWISPRSLDKSRCYLSPDEKALEMTADHRELSEPNPGSLLLRRQTAPVFEFEVDVDLDSLKEGVDAGACCYYDRFSYLKWGVCREKTQIRIELVEREGTQERIVVSTSAAGEKIMSFRIETDKMSRSFYYRNDQSDWTLLGKLSDVSYLCDEGGSGKRFTGPMYGIYCIDRNRRGNQKIRFKGRNHT